MGYESLVLPVGDWKLQIDHNDHETSIAIVDDKGVYRFIRLTRDQAQKLKRHLNTALPFDQQND